MADIHSLKLLSFYSSSEYMKVYSYDYGQKHVNCTAEPDYVPWIWNTFQECVTDTIEYVGFILGLVQIFCWIIVFLPQFWENYKKGKMDEAIAPSFLILWMFGDISNLVGCILTQQLPTQFVTAIYYLLMDVLIISQFSYYYFKNKRTVQVMDSSQEHPTIQAKNDNVHVIYCCGFLLTTSLLVSMPWQQGQGSSGHVQSHATGRSLLSTDVSDDEPCSLYYMKTSYCVFFDAIDIFGYVCGCFSGMFYVCSRIPQLVKNHQRKSVEGVSLLMFILTVLGNTFYGASVMMEDTSIVFLIRHLPWLFGSLGTLVFDCVMLCQFANYRYCRPKRELVIEEDRRRLLNGTL